MKLKVANVSICITTYNETEERVKKLLDALSKQTLKPDEIIIVEATRISNLKFLIFNQGVTSSAYQFSKLNLQIINKPNTSRAEGRNLAIKFAKNEIIAITDVGCVPHNDWLEKITNPFKKGNIDVVSGGYKMIAKNNFEKAESVFLGVKQNDMNKEFMPSARSIAFTKAMWKKAGGFPEDLIDTAEDTIFNLNLIKAGAKFVTEKTAVVDWEMPESISKFYLKIKNYARGDVQSGIWWHPVKKWRTHNIKVLLIIIRYVVGCWLLVFSLLNNWTLGYWYIFALFGIYLIWAYSKAGLWGILLQLTSDFACIIGFSHGILQTGTKRD